MHISLLRIEMQNNLEKLSKLPETVHRRKDESYPRSFFALQVSLVDDA